VILNQPTRSWYRESKIDVCMKYFNIASQVQ
jgi:hypothetical protein